MHRPRLGWLIFGAAWLIWQASSNVLTPAVSIQAGYMAAVALNDVSVKLRTFSGSLINKAFAITEDASRYFRSGKSGALLHACHSRLVLLIIRIETTCFATTASNARPDTDISDT
jgi:hypothetical protein